MREKVAKAKKWWGSQKEKHSKRQEEKRRKEEVKLDKQLKELARKEKIAKKKSKIRKKKERIKKLEGPSALSKIAGGLGDLGKMEFPTLDLDMPLLEEPKRKKKRKQPSLW